MKKVKNTSRKVRGRVTSVTHDRKVNVSRTTRGLNQVAARQAELQLQRELLRQRMFQLKRYIN